MCFHEAAFQWIQDEYAVLPVTSLKKEIQAGWCNVRVWGVHDTCTGFRSDQAWTEIQAATLRSRAMYGIRLWRKTPERSLYSGHLSRYVITLMYKMHMQLYSTLL